MPKQLAIPMAVLGGAALVGSMFLINHPDHSKWFPVLLIGGGALIWWGIQKFRDA
jgi:hypothetical protein